MVSEKQFDAEIARHKRNEYYRKWRKNNPDKVKEYNERYWAKKFEADMTKESEVNNEN